MTMDWFALDRYGREWFPYVTIGQDGSGYLFMHFIDSDTDMGDLSFGELIQILGPVSVHQNPRKVESQ